MLAPLRALVALTLVAASAAVAASSYTLSEAKLSVTSLDGGSVRLSEAFTASQSPKQASVDLAPDEILRVSFSVQGEEGAPAPQQVSVLLTDQNGRSLVTPATVKKGKANWTLRPDRVPTLGRTLSATLLLAHPDASYAPLSLALLTKLTLPGSEPTLQTARQQALQAQGFLTHPARFHTFGVSAKDKMPPKVISMAAAAGVVVLPWTLLAILLSQVLPSLTFRTPGTPVLLLLATLGFLELLAVRYWWGNGFTLFSLLPWLGAGGVASVLAGRQALGELRRARSAK